MTDELQATVDNAAPNDPSTTKNDDEKAKRIWRKLLFLPYFLGIGWTCLHPIASVLTGEPKCRGWYIDEHSIETKFASMDRWDTPEHLKIAKPREQGIAQLCDNFENKKETNLICHSHGNSFQLVTIVPQANTLDPTEEAIVFVVPPPSTGDWSTSSFHYTLVHVLRRLADPIVTPWLAKTIIFVVPTTSPMSSEGREKSPLNDTVSDFIDAYLGSRQASSRVPPLPPRLSGSFIRSMVVLDLEDKAEKGARQMAGTKLGRADLSILPHGRRGVLPNADLVFLIGRLFGRPMFMNKNKHPESTFLAHGYTQQSKDAHMYVDSFAKEHSLGRKTSLWAKEMADLGLFAYSLAMGPFPPHAPALDRGIDSISIQVSFEGVFYRDPSIELVQYMEYVVRALANLHERLHHSFTLYLLPSPKKFVSHVEYLLPNILLLLPLAVRAFGLVMFETRLHLQTVGCALLVATLSMGTMLLSSVMVDDSDVATTNTWLFVFYALVILIWKTFILRGRTQNKEFQRVLSSLQFVACTTAVYILVPIAFAHVSLAYVPSALLTPLLAFPFYGGEKDHKWWTWLAVILVFVTAPPVLLVPRIFDRYTTFVRFAYVPLHVQLLLLVVTRLLTSSKNR